MINDAASLGSNLNSLYISMLKYIFKKSSKLAGQTVLRAIHRQRMPRFGQGGLQHNGAIHFNNAFKLTRKRKKKEMNL